MCHDKRGAPHGFEKLGCPMMNALLHEINASEMGDI